MTDAVKALTEAQLDEIERWGKFNDNPDRLVNVRAATVLSLVSMSRAALAAQGEAAPVACEPDTGHAEADRVIGRLMSSDPDFNDCNDAALLIRKLVIEQTGPDGYATWKDAAIEARLHATRPTPPADAAGAIPKGWKLVPEEPTSEMIFAGVTTVGTVAISGVPVWQAMLTAAPSPPRAADDERLQRLRDAIEGECNGLAINDETARKILAYLSPADHPAISARSSSPLPYPEQNQDQQIDPDRP